tara:strand:+ start:3867 stop:4145 length:279 start_codon:yes stop_codon:yes gene_type:complete
MRRLKLIDPDAVKQQTLELAGELIEGNWLTIKQAMKESDKREGKFTLQTVIKPCDIGHELIVKFNVGITYKDEASCELTDPNQTEINLNDEN